MLTDNAPSARRRRRPVRAALASAALAAAGCSAAPAPGPAPLPACRAPQAPILPNTAGSLTQSDSGSYCLAAGQVLDVFLTVPDGAAPDTRWGQIKAADPSVVGYGNNGVLTPPIGVTPGVFAGIRTGSTTLSSSLPDGTTWRVTIVVK